MISGRLCRSPYRGSIDRLRPSRLATRSRDLVGFVCAIRDDTKEKCYCSEAIFPMRTSAGLMPYTSNCDLYAAVNEAGINLVARHVMRQRPSLFNYATAAIAQDPQLACVQVA